MSGDDDMVLDRPKRQFAPASKPASITDRILADAAAHMEPGKAAARPAAVHPAPEPPPQAARPGADGEPGAGPEFFDPDSQDYKAFGWAGHKTVPSLRLIFKDGSEKGIVYAHLDSHPQSGSEFIPATPGRRGNTIRLRVAGQGCAFLLIIAGLLLRRVWELLLGHQTPWIHELPPGAVPLRNDEPVIWSISFEMLPADAVAVGGR